MNYDEIKKILSQASRIICHENGQDNLLVYHDGCLYCSNPIRAGLSKRHIREVKRVKVNDSEVEVFW